MSKAQYNQLVRKLVQDTKLLINVSQKMASEGHQETNTDTSDDSSGDDVVNINGEQYYYHPPNINERVQLKWSLDDGGTIWSVATIKKKTKRGRKIFYTILYDDGQKDRDYLSITDFPEKWRFVDN
jgi:hypothetical protein